MTTVDQVAPLEPAIAAQPAGAPLDPTASAAMPVASRLIGAIAVGVALLSAAATFLVLAGLTPIAPVHEVVVKLLLGRSGGRVCSCSAIIGREVWMVVRARRRGYAGSRLHVQIVGLFAVIAAVPDRPGRRGRQHHARPRPRPVLLDPHARHDRAIDDRGRRLCQRARPGDPRRDHGHGLRSRPRQADVRFRPRALPEILHRAGDRARPFRRDDDPRRRLDGRARRRQDGQDDRAAVDEAAQPDHGDRAADRAHSRRRSRRRGRQAARLRRHVSLRRADARSARGRAIARDAGERRRIRQSRSAPARHSDRLRVDVRRHRADRAAVLGVDRARFRQPPGGADPPPDRRRQRGLDRQSARCACRSAAPKATSRSSARPSTT